MKRRMISLLLALALIITCLPQIVLPARAADDDFVIDKNGVLTEYNGSGGAVVIPSSVTSIGEFSFYNCSSLTNVTIPASVTSIGNDAFRQCRSLTSVTIGNSVTSIGEHAFYNCSGLTSIKIPNNVKSIGNEAFCLCSGLTSVTIGSSVTSIGEAAFKECWSLTDVTIPASVTSIGVSAFWGCTSLKSVTILDSAASIGKLAFGDCSNLTDVKLGNNLTGIGEEAFYETACYYNENNWSGDLLYVDCWLIDAKENVAAAKIKAGIRGIACRALYGCSSLTNVTIPDGVTSIGDYSFFNCSSLTNVTIPNSVKNLGNDAFYACTNLTSVTIGNSVTSIGESAFSDCSSLTNVTIPKSVTNIGKSAFSSCSSLTSVTIPDSVTSISDYAFWGCSSLTSMAVPKSVTSIDYWTFSGCSNMASVTIPASVKSIAKGAFKECNALKDAYYGGSENDWGKITIGSSNDPLKNATIHYNIEGNIDPSGGNTNPSENTRGYQLRVYTTDSSFSVEEGKEMYFDVRLFHDGNSVHTWDAPSLTISNNKQIASAYVGDYHDYAYSIRISAFSEGATNLVLTDTESGAFITIPIRVFKKLDGKHSFWIMDVPKFYPDYFVDKKIETNFYDIDGIYIKNLKYTTEKDGIHVSFDAYNEGYSHGSVDIYNAAGEWIDCVQIKKFSDVSGIYDSLECLYRTGRAAIGDGMLAYTSGMLSEHTEIKDIVIPKNGYFTITNNCQASLGAYIYNIADFIVLETETLISTTEGIDSISESFAKAMIKGMNKDQALREVVVDQMQSITLDVFKRGVNKNKAATSMRDLCEQFVNATDEYLNINELLNVAFDVGESGIEKFGGPAGWALSVITAEVKYSNYLMQVAEICNHLNHSPVYIHAPRSKETETIMGVSVEGKRNIPDDAILQVFRLYDIDILEWFSNKSDLSQYDYQIYNICFVVGDSTVSPTGKVTVKIKVPPSKQENYYLYREEGDGAWTLLNPQYINGYLVFETDHFSNYAVFFEPLSSSDKPGKDNGFRFDDVKNEKAFYYNAVYWAYNAEPQITNGVDKTHFGPDQGCTRGQVVTFLWRATGCPAPKSTKTKFKDVGEKAFYAKAVAWAVEKGITKGMTADTFAPDATCTRGQIVTFLWRFKNAPAPKSAATKFTDVRDKAFYAKAVAWAVENKVTNGMTAITFAPDNTCTRGQIVTFLYRAKNGR